VDLLGTFRGKGDVRLLELIGDTGVLFDELAESGILVIFVFSVDDALLSYVVYVDLLPEPLVIGLLLIVLLFCTRALLTPPGLTAPPGVFGCPVESNAVMFWFLRAADREDEVVALPPCARRAVFSLIVAESTVF